MGLSDTLLPEYDREMEITRKAIARIPEDKLTWQPHEKSMTLGGLATHLANLLTWTIETLENDSTDIASPEGKPQSPEPVASVPAALEMFDKNVADARIAIAAASDELLMAPWSLLEGGQTLLTMPKITVLRYWILNHSIHHRAQLGIYLRLNDVPLPSTYGQSADEAG